MPDLWPLQPVDGESLLAGALDMLGWLTAPPSQPTAVAWSLRADERMTTVRGRDVCARVVGVDETGIVRARAVGLLDVLPSLAGWQQLTDVRCVDPLAHGWIAAATVGPWVLAVVDWRGMAAALLTDQAYGQAVLDAMLKIDFGDAVRARRAAARLGEDALPVATSALLETFCAEPSCWALFEVGAAVRVAERPAQTPAAVLSRVHRELRAEAHGRGLHSDRSRRRPVAFEHVDYAEPVSEWSDPTGETVICDEPAAVDLTGLCAILSVRQAQALLLRAEGRTVPSVAAAMAVSERYVRRLLAQARQRLAMAPPAARSR